MCIRDRTASFARQVLALSARQLTVATRHPLLFYVNFGATVAVSLLCGIAFWQLDRGDFDTVLSRIGLAFFLCLYFTLTALVSLGMWQHERMLYFHEHGAGAYGPAAFLASKAIFELLPLRVLPSLLCAAIVYPMAGLRADDAHGAAAAALFAGALCLTNLCTSVAFTSIGMLAKSPGVATLTATLFSLLNLLFSGFLVSPRTLAGYGPVAAALPRLSYFYYFFELFTSNELLGAVVMVQPQTVDLPPVPLPGIEILAQLGYETGECARLLGGGGGGCAYSLYVLGGWVAAGLALSYLVLRFCVKDPH